MAESSATGETGGSLPKVTFSAFVMSLASAALVQLGEVPDPESGRTGVDLGMARHNIDVLEMLLQKCQGNLNAEEKSLLESILYELRLKYVLKADSK